MILWETIIRLPQLFVSPETSQDVVGEPRGPRHRIYRRQHPSEDHFWATPAPSSAGESLGYKMRGLSCFLVTCLRVKSAERKKSRPNFHQVHQEPYPHPIPNIELTLDPGPSRESEKSSGPEKCQRKKAMGRGKRRLQLVSMKSRCGLHAPPNTT